MKRKKESGSKNQDAEVWESPEFKNLAAGLDQILRLPKSEMDKRLATEQAEKLKKNPDS
jgi:hypothetical protein